MRRYRLARAAKEDLKSIVRYVATDSRFAAGCLKELFAAKFELLAANPYLGEPREEYGPDRRIFPAGSYVIIYKPTRLGITVLQIVHGARNLEVVARRP